MMWCSYFSEAYCGLSWSYGGSDCTLYTVVTDLEGGFVTKAGNA